MNVSFEKIMMTCIITLKIMVIKIGLIIKEHFDKTWIAQNKKKCLNVFAKCKTKNIWSSKTRNVCKYIT